MCGIAGFSLSTKSRINVRKLSNSLLSELDIRGNQAAGFAYQTRTQQGSFKQATSGASLSLKSMPRSTRSAILHTRYATHGSINDPRNNHPIPSPDKSIQLVHNGVIYNHDLVRSHLDFKLPEVDSSVIPAILQQFDRDFNKLSMLDGDAAIAWLDKSDLGVMRVARVNHSPLFISQLKDGSFVWASTQEILTRALRKSGLKPVYAESVPERTLLVIRDGMLSTVEALPETDPEFVDYSWVGSYKSYRNMTSGGHGSVSSYEDDWYDYDPKATNGSNTQPKYVKYQSAWGEVTLPEETEEEFPVVNGLWVNEYGEYFDLEEGHYIGHYEDLVEMGFIGQGWTTDLFSIRPVEDDSETKPIATIS